MGYGPVGMNLPWPLTDGRVTVRPAEEADAPAFLAYQFTSASPDAQRPDISVLARLPESLFDRA